MPAIYPGGLTAAQVAAQANARQGPQYAAPGSGMPGSGSPLTLTPAQQAMLTADPTGANNADYQSFLAPFKSAQQAQLAQWKQNANGTWNFTGPGGGFSLTAPQVSSTGPDFQQWLQGQNNPQYLSSLSTFVNRAAGAPVTAPSPPPVTAPNAGSATAPTVPAATTLQTQTGTAAPPVLPPTGNTLPLTNTNLFVAPPAGGITPPTNTTDLSSALGLSNQDYDLFSGLNWFEGIPGIQQQGGSLPSMDWASIFA